MDMSVVFPAPFSPTRPTISPSAKVIDTSSTALFAPKDFVMCDRRMGTVSRGGAEARRKALELASRNFKFATADLGLDARDLGDGLRRERRLQFVVPDQRDDVVVHA